MPNFMIKFNNPGAKWRDIDEDMIILLIEKHYPCEDLKTKLIDLKRGNSITVGSANIEVWPTEKEN